MLSAKQMNAIIKSNHIEVMRTLSREDFSDGGDVSITSFVNALLMAKIGFAKIKDSNLGEFKVTSKGLKDEPFLVEAVQVLDSLSVKMDPGIEWPHIVKSLNAVFRMPLPPVAHLNGFAAVRLLTQYAPSFDIDTVDDNGVSLFMTVTGCRSLDIRHMRYLEEMGANQHLVSSKHGPAFHFLDLLDVDAMEKLSELVRSGADISCSKAFQYWREDAVIEDPVIYKCFKDFLLREGNGIREYTPNFDMDKQLSAAIDRFSASVKAVAALDTDYLAEKHKSKKRRYL